MADSFIEEAGLNEGEDGACDEDIEVPFFCSFLGSYFVPFCPFLLFYFVISYVCVDIYSLPPVHGPLI